MPNPPERIKRIIQKLRGQGLRRLTEDECCILIDWQLKQIYKWQQKVYDRLFGGPGSTTPPPPPKWPP